MDVTPLGNGRYLIREGTRQQLAYAISNSDSRWVFLDGMVQVVEAGTAASRPRARHAHDEAALASPMPATVVAVTVEPGQQVKKGDVLVRLEAMKMELEVRAPRDGRVSGVACRKGDLVQPGIPLVEMS